MLNLRVYGFRCISQAEYEFPEGVTVLLGKNGAGKSTVIQAICLALFGKVPSTNDKQLSPKAFNESYKIELSNEQFSIVQSLDLEQGQEFQATVEGVEYLGSRKEKRERFLNWLGIEQNSGITEVISRLLIYPYSLSILSMSDEKRASYLLSALGSVQEIDMLWKKSGEEMRKTASEVADLKDRLSDLGGIETLSETDLEAKIDQLKSELEGKPTPAETQSEKLALERYNKELKQEQDAYCDFKNLIGLKVAEIQKDGEYKSYNKTDLQNFRNVVLRGLAEISLELSKVFYKDKPKICPVCETKLLDKDGNLIIFDDVEAASLIAKFDSQKTLLTNKQIEIDSALSEVERRERIAQHIEKLRDREVTYTERCIDLNEKKLLAKKLIEAGESCIEKWIKLIEAETELAKIKENNRIAVLKADYALQLKNLKKHLQIDNFLFKFGLRILRAKLVKRGMGILQSLINEILIQIDADGTVEFVPVEDEEGRIIKVEAAQVNKGVLRDFDFINESEKRILAMASILGVKRFAKKEMDKLNLTLFDDAFFGLDQTRLEKVARYVGSLSGVIIVTTQDEKVAELLSPIRVYNL